MSNTAPLVTLPLVAKGLGVNAGGRSAEAFSKSDPSPNQFVRL